MTKLTENFALEEFTDSQAAARAGVSNMPADGSDEMKNLQRTAKVMERVRTILGHPILISSGYRSSKVNMMVGGGKNSAHVHGLAADFTSPGFGTPFKICQTLELHMRELEIDQLIHEYATWVHLGLRDSNPRYQCLTIDTHGVRNGFG